MFLRAVPDNPASSRITVPGRTAERHRAAVTPVTSQLEETVKSN
jgi:hypothetical protein